MCIRDRLVSNLDCGGVTMLVPGDDLTCTGSYTVTQADIDADGIPAGSGAIVNTATASSNQTPNLSDEARVTVSQAPAYTIAKTVTDVGGEGPTGVADEVGDVISFDVVVANTGNLTLTNVVVDDPLVPLSCTPTSPATLNPGDRLTCTGSYTVTQADLDDDGNPAGSGQIVNIATVSSDELPDEEGTARVIVSQAPAYTIAKTVTDVGGDGPTGVADEVGDTIAYEVVVENTGNTTLNNVNVDDPLAPLTCTPTVPAVLNPADTLTCSGSYDVTQADLDDNGNPTADSGQVVNTATVSSDELAEEQDTASVTLASSGAYTITKTVTDVGGDGPTGIADEVGDTITYEVVVENTGNTTLNSVSVDDPLAPLTCTPTVPAVLNPADTLTCSGSYDVQQSDLLDDGNPAGSGEIQNTATVTSDELPLETDTASVIVKEPELVIEVLAEVCINDVPYLEYDINAAGLEPGLPVTIRFFGDGGNGSTDPADYTVQVEELTGQADSGQVLWPGAAVDAEGNGTAWPGWEQLPDSSWVEIDDGLVPTLLMEFEINPTAQQIIQYPPESENCIPPQFLPPDIAIPANNPWALLLLMISVLGIGWYYRPIMQ